MGKITGLEEIENIPPKVLQMYRAVIELLEGGEDISGLRVSTITDKAGIGKGTAYEYFDTKEEIVACALVYYMQWIFEWLESSMLEKENFGGQVDFILNIMSTRDKQNQCFIRALHILTDSSEFSSMIRERLSSERLRRFSPFNVFERVLKKGIERGEVRDDLPLDYMCYLFFSHLISYMMALANEKTTDAEADRIKEYVHRGILEQLC